jgi:hypothetical protein
LAAAGIVHRLGPMADDPDGDGRDDCYCDNNPNDENRHHSV